MSTRLGSCLLVIGLVLTGVSWTGAQEPPFEAIAAGLQHVVGQAEAKAVVVTDRFANAEGVRGVASSLGVRALKRAEVVQCSEDRKSCRIVGPEKRLISLREAKSVGADVVLSLVISTQVESSDGSAQLFPTLREITLARVDGRWRVTGDQVVMQR